MRSCGARPPSRASRRADCRRTETRGIFNTGRRGCVPDCIEFHTTPVMPFSVSRAIKWAPRNVPPANSRVRSLPDVENHRAHKYIFARSVTLTFSFVKSPLCQSYSVKGQTANKAAGFVTRSIPVICHSRIRDSVDYMERDIRERSISD